jgi:hypothetical protein
MAGSWARGCSLCSSVIPPSLTRSGKGAARKLPSGHYGGPGGLLKSRLPDSRLAACPGKGELAVSDLQKARELENFRYTDLVEKASLKERQRVQEFRAAQNARGCLQSGATFRGIAKFRAERIEELILGRVAIRKDLAREFPELGSEDALNALIVDLERLVSLGFKGLHQTPGLQMEGVVANALQGQDDQEVFRLNAFARRQVEMLKREISLNLHKKVPASAVSVNTGGGAAIVNLGEIHGNVQQVIGTLNEAGQGELAGHLERLAAAIEADTESAEDRAAFLEQVRLIAEQASAAESDRNPHLVRGTLLGLRGALQHSANVAQILSVAGPIIAHHFGFHWPM